VFLLLYGIGQIKTSFLRCMLQSALIRSRFLRKFNSQGNCFFAETSCDVQLYDLPQKEVFETFNVIIIGRKSLFLSIVSSFLCVGSSTSSYYCVLRCDLPGAGSYHRQAGNTIPVCGPLYFVRTGILHTIRTHGHPEYSLE